MPPYDYPYSHPQDGNQAKHPVSSGAYVDDRQPGLEVVQNWDEQRATPGLQVGGPNLHLKNVSSDPEATGHSEPHGGQGLHPSALEGPVPSNASKQSDHAWGGDKAAAETTSAEKATRKKRWRLWGIASVVAVLVIVGATVGGVLGSKASGGSPSISPGSIRRNSRLAVTGVRYSNDNYTLRVFSQDNDNTLNYVEKKSADSDWSKACQLKNTLDYTPRANSSMAACMQRTRSGGYQWILVYIDDRSSLRGLVFSISHATESRGKEGKLSSQAHPVIVDANSRLGCYWPYIMSQDAGGPLRWTEFVGPGDSRVDWYRNDTGIDARGSEGTGMVPLPITQSFRNEAGFVYRGTDGRLTTGVKEYNTTESPEWGQSQPAVAIPAESAIAAFSVGRDNTPDSVDTYILYQDDAGVIQVVWRDGKDGHDGWQGPQTYPALDNAEIGTDIACATMGGGNEGGGSAFTVSKQQDMNRCFFQEKGTGRLKEVWFNGTDWEGVRFVPIDYGDGKC